MMLSFGHPTDRLRHPMSRRPTSLLALPRFRGGRAPLSFTNAAHELHVSQAQLVGMCACWSQISADHYFVRLPPAGGIDGTRKATRESVGGRFLADMARRRSCQGHAGATARISVEPAFAARWSCRASAIHGRRIRRLKSTLESSDEMRTVRRDPGYCYSILTFAKHASRRGWPEAVQYAGFPVIASGIVPIAGRASDSDYWLSSLHDDDGSEWRRWFAAAGLDGFDTAKHLHFNDSSLRTYRMLRGQGVALTAPSYVGSRLRSGRLTRIGRTAVTFGDYWAARGSDRGTAKAPHGLSSSGSIWRPRVYFAPE